MTRPYRHIEVEMRGDAFCVRLLQTRLNEPVLYELASELRGLVVDGGCREMALSLGPKPPECLYSVFLAKLISLQRLLSERGGGLILCHASPVVHEIFAACCLDRLFHFLPDFEAAVVHWNEQR